MPAHLVCPSRESLAALVSGQLPANEAEPLRRHLTQCPRCQQLAAALNPPATELIAPAEVSPDLTLPTGTAPPSQSRTDATSPLVSASSPAAARPAEEEIDLAFLQPSDQPGSMGRLEHFEILSVIGRGGMGVVLRARDTQVERIVAIKVMAPELAASGTARQRFLREARTAAAVRHANVVAIHAVSETNHLPFLVMQYVPGLSLQQKLDRDGPPELREILRIGLEMAQGLAAAHKQGLIHRDIKPANILLEGSVAQVKITDFGLARAMDDASVTQSGVVAGTPMYMSPEQARGEAVDARSDLFSLGSVLYILCTGHPPFRAGNTMAVLRRVCEESPRPIRGIRPEIPAWLANLIARLHAKEPADRFQTAREVADLLEQRLALLQQGIEVPDDPGATVDVAPAKIAKETRRPQDQETARQQKGIRKRSKTRLLVSLSCLLVFLLTAAFVFDLIPWPFGERDPGNPTSGETRWIKLFNGRNLSGWTMHPGQPGAWRVENGVLVGEGPKRSHLFTKRNDFENFHLRVEARINPEGDGGLCFRTEFGLTSGIETPRGYEAQLLGDRKQEGIKTGSICHYYNLDEQPAPTGDWFTYEVIAQANHLVTLINGTPVVDFVDPSQTYRQGCLALQVFDANTRVEFRKIEIKRLGPADLLLERTIKDRKHEQIPPEELLEAGLGDPARAPADLVAVYGSSRLKHWADVTSLEFTPDSQQLVSAGNDGIIRIASSKDGKTIHLLRGHVGKVNSVAVSRDGKLASGGSDGTIRLWDPATGPESRQLAASPAEVVRVVFSPDGKRLACGCGDKGAVKVLDGQTGAEVWTLDDWPGPIYDLAWSPDGKVLAVAGSKTAAQPAPAADQTSLVRLLDAGTGKLLRDLDFGGSDRRGQMLAFAPDSSRVAVLTPDGVIVCEVASGKSAATIALPHKEGLALAWRPDGKVLVTADKAGIRAWEPATANLVYETKGYSAGAQCLAFSPDNQLLAGALGQQIILWDGTSGERLREPHTHVRCNGVAFSPYGHCLATAMAWGTHLWHTGYNSRLASVWQAHHSVVWSKDGTMLATCGGDRKIRLFTPTGRELRTLEGHTADIWGLAFSPDGLRLASGGLDRMLRFWNPATGARQQALVQPAAVECLAWSPDGRYLAGSTGDLAVWNGQNGQLIPNAPRHGGKVWWVAFSPDSRLLASAGYDGSIKFWETVNWTLTRTLPGHAGGTSGVAFSPDGQTLASRGRDNRIWLWDVGSGHLLREWSVLGPGRRVAFAPDGLHIVTGNENGTAYVFRLPPHFRYEMQKAVPAQEGLPFTAVGAGFLLPEIQFLWCLALSPDGKTLAAGGADRVRIFEWNNGWQPGPTLTGHTAHVRGLTFSRDGQLLISGSEDHTIRLWRKQQSAWIPDRVPVLRGHAMKIYSLTLAQDGRTLISVGGEWGTGRPGEIKRWDLTTGQAILPVWTPQPATAIGVVTLSPDGKTLATGRDDGVIEIRDPATGKVQTTLEHKGQVVTLAFSPDSSLLASGNLFNQERIKLWKRQDNQWQFQGDLPAQGSTLQLLFDPSGTLLASTGYTKTKLWHVPTGDELALLEGHLNRCDGLLFTPDGKSLLTAGLDQSIRMWNIVPQKTTAQQPFVVLAREGRPQRRCFSLAGACALAGDGDTIEVQGNGPFLVRPILIEDKAIVLRAGAGFRPVLVAREDNQTTLLFCKGKLTLEGLEFRNIGRIGPWHSLVHCERGTLQVLNCRFVVQGDRFSVWTRGEQTLIRNCEFLSQYWHGLGWTVPARGQVEIENSVFNTPITLEVPAGQPRLEDLRFRISRSTLASPAQTKHPHLFSFRLYSLPILDKDGLFRIELEDSVLVFGEQLALLNRWSPLQITTDGLEKAYQRLLSWKEGKNAILAGPPLLQFGNELHVLPDARTLKDRAEWEEFWKLPKTEMLTGPIRFTEELDRKNLVPTPSTAFKLHPDSTGVKAGPEGKDLGVDVELLGPSAYEVFRQSPAYKEWLKATNQGP